jgi:ABC-2 type transport system ATP-binding protein
LYWDLRLGESFELLRRIYQIPDEAYRSNHRWLEDSLGLKEMIDSPVRSLSLGQRTRAEVAAALLHDPDILFLDEPTIGLDPGQVVEVRELIREIGKERTVLLSTHLLNEAQNICDRVLIINKGKIVAEDTTENLQARLLGAERVIIRVRGEADDELAKAIKAIKGVRDVEIKNDGSVEFEFASGKDLRPEVAKQIIKSGYDLLELRPLGMSLEEIFLELTGNDGKKK